MNYRPLGLTGMYVSEIGFGAWGIGGTAKNTLSYGPTNDQASKKALKCALELGITFFDTADLYGDGHSEKLIGDVFRKDRHRVIIASKVGYLNSTGKQNFHLTHVQKAFQGSLKRLKTDYIDLYQLHDPNPLYLKEYRGTLQYLVKLQEKGKIRAIGATLRSPEDGIRLIKNFKIKVIQVNFNMTDQRALQSGLFDLCAKKGVGVIVRTPLCFGFLTGKYNETTKFHPQDHRTRWSAKQLKLWSEAPQIFKTSKNQTQAQYAIRFCLSYPMVSTVIPGMLTQEHVQENARASQIKTLSSAEQKRIEKTYQNHTFFVR